MTPKTAQQELELRINQISDSQADLTPAQGIRVMLAFYKDTRADGCALDEDGDMLLFQWGTHDWGDGPSFQIDITRQFVLAHPASEDDDDAISQLSLRFHFPPSPQFTSTGAGNQWCHTPDELEIFQAFILASKAYQAVQNSRASTVVLHFQDGGV